MAILQEVLYLMFINKHITHRLTADAPNRRAC